MLMQIVVVVSVVAAVAATVLIVVGFAREVWRDWQGQ